VCDLKPNAQNIKTLTLPKLLDYLQPDLTQLEK